MHEEHTGFGKNDKDMPFEGGIENLSNEMIYQAIDYVNTEDTNSAEPIIERDLRKEFGSTGVHEEYTATREERYHKIKAEDNEKESIANMNVEGMPWFYEEPSEIEMQKRNTVPELSRRETRRLIFSSLLAALLIAGVFIVAIFLFLLFATNVWFK